MGASDALWRVEQSDDRVRKASELAQRGNDWLRSEPIDFAESYSRGKMNLAVRSRLSDRKNLGFLIKRREVISEQNGRDERCALYSDVVRRNRGGDKACVLSSKINIMQGAEEIISSSIRLEAFDNASIGAGKFLYLFHTAKRVHKIHDAIADGEINIFHGEMAVALGESRNKNIEARAYGVGDYPGLGGNEEWGWLRSNVERFCSCVSIYLFAGGMYARAFDPIGNAFLQDWDLGYGPINAGLSV
jgi:hypothetical protein